MNGEKQLRKNETRRTEIRTANSKSPKESRNGLLKKFKEKNKK